MNMNIAEILKDCPTGTKLYSPVYGEIMYLYIDNSSNYPIVAESDADCSVSFTLDGRLDANYTGECMLFPSKDNRDWSTFKASKKEYEFKPFNKVLVRNEKSDVWNADLFSHCNPDYDSIYHYCTIGRKYKQCISYKGNEHLLGTTNNPD